MPISPRDALQHIVDLCDTPDPSVNLIVEIASEALTEADATRKAMPISPEDVVKVIMDTRFWGLRWHNCKYECTICGPTDAHQTETSSPLSALAWAKGMFDAWDAKEDTHG